MPHGLASLVSQLTPGNKAVRLLPAGVFRSSDGSGRPADAPSWRIDAAMAASLIAKFNARASRRVVDYEHQTLQAAQNGQPAPAAGWIEALDYRDGDGLYATIAWTDKAAAMIAAGEYRYISPVFPYDATGRVLDILHAGLTNNPGLDGLTDLAALSAAFTHSLISDQELLPMKDLLKALGLAATATESEAIAAVATLNAKAAESETKITALTAQVGQAPDPAKYVPVATVADLQGQIASLTAEKVAREVGELVDGGLADGRILPAMEAWATDLGKKDVAALKGFLDAAKPVAALAGTQTGGRKPGEKSAAGQLDEAQLAACSAFGLTAEDFQKTLAAV